MTRRLLRASCWFIAGAIVVLLTRSITYAISPSPVARVLEHRAGGPGLPVLTLAALGLGASVALAVTWLAAVGVRERAFVAGVPAPRFRPVRLIVAAAVLALLTSLAGGLFEAYLHWRAGLGWHGLHCVFGPVHRDLWPIASALSLVATALVGAAGHVLAWMRQTFARLRDVPPRVAAAVVVVALPLDVQRVPRRSYAGNPRAPPALS